MKSDNVIVKDSGIDSKGVFALRDFKKGEIVMTWDESNHISREEYNALPYDERRYVCRIDEHTFVKHKAPEKYVNHSCDANTREKDGCDVAIRDIKKGEEVTSDYGAPGETDPFFRCTCGSKKCRGVVKQYVE